MVRRCTKRDKALKEYDAATELLAEAEQLDRNYQDIWAKANDNIQTNGFISEKCWIEWEQANETKQRSIALQQKYRSIIQGVLIYDSELEEANEAMAGMIIKDIIHAVALGELRRRESLEEN